MDPGSNPGTSTTCSKHKADFHQGVGFFAVNTLKHRDIDKNIYADTISYEQGENDSFWKKSWWNRGGICEGEGRTIKHCENVQALWYNFKTDNNGE